MSAISGRHNTVEHWTDQETLLLLEGIELYNENWDQIAEHVGSKSKEQCLLHFIRLPVEDSFIENHFFGQSETSDSVKSTASVNKTSPTSLPVENADSEMTDVEGATIKTEPTANATGTIIIFCSIFVFYLSIFSEPAEQSLFNSKTLTPFSSTSNPLMLMVAFLASSVNPSVASAAAQAALESLTKKEEAKEGAEKVDSSESEKPKEGGDLTKQGLQAATAAALSAAVLKSKVCKSNQILCKFYLQFYH